MQSLQHLYGEQVLARQQDDNTLLINTFLTGTCQFREIRLHLAIVFLATLLVYFWSAPSTVTLEDDGYFILAAYYNGIAHPPGYPLYTLLAHVLTCLPFGNIALRVHLVSALFSAVSCLFLWWISCFIFRKTGIAYVVALSFGFSRVFWSQSIIAEVYSLQVLLFTLIFFTSICLLRARTYKNRQLALKFIFLFTGLGLSNHWPLLVLSLPCIAALLWPQRDMIIHNITRSIPYFLAGLLPYAWMVFRSQMNPEISFFGTISNLSDFWFYISRGAYAGIDTSPGAGLYDKLQFGIYFLQQTAGQFGIIGSLFVITGFLYQWRLFPKNFCIALLLGFLAPSFGLICLLDFDYDFLHQTIFRVYPVIAYWVSAIWEGCGVMAVAQFLIKRAYRQLNNKIPVTGLAILVVGTIFIGSAVTNYRSDDLWARNYATVLLKTLPENAVFFVSGDTTVGPVGYMHHIRHYRQDIALYSMAGTVFKNRLFEPYKVTDSQISTILNRFFSETSRPVYYNEYLRHDYGREFYGLYYKLLVDRKKDYHRAIAIPEVLSYMDMISRQGLPADPWEQIHYRTLLARGCSLVSMITDNADQPGDYRQLYTLKNKLCSNLLGQYIQLDHLLNNNNADRQRIKNLLDGAEKFVDQAITKEQSSRLDYFHGIFSIHEKKYGQAEQYFRACIEKWPHPDNPARKKLEELKTRAG